MNKKNNQCIVLIPSKFHNARKACESVENQEFKDIKALLHELHDVLDKSKNGDEEDVLVFAMTDFMDEVNNDDVDLTKYSMSYVHLLK